MTEKRTTKITKQQQYKYLSICLDRSFSPDNFDPIVNEAIEILNHLKTEKAKQSALAMLRQIQILEG